MLRSNKRQSLQKHTVFNSSKKFREPKFDESQKNVTASGIIFKTKRKFLSERSQTLDKITVKFTIAVPPSYMNAQFTAVVRGGISTDSLVAC